jgi:carbon-monoxide dehydrogenase medium subunit
LALDASVVLADTNGERVLPLASFIRGPGETVLRPDQLLQEILIDVPAGRSFGCYFKLMRRKAVDLAVVGVAFQAVLNGTGDRMEQVAIGLGGVAPTPIRARQAESILKGLSYDEAIEKLPELGKTARVAALPISEVRASAAYRSAIVEVYVQRAARRSLDELFCSEGARA